MKKWVSVFSLMASTSVMAIDGKVLHDAACLQCHASLTADQPNSLYTRSDRKVESFVALQKRVKGCAVAADAKWSEQQRETVVHYLSTTFYHFEN